MVSRHVQHISDVVLSISTQSMGARARNTALVVFMLPPLPVANAITIGSRFFLSFIGFSLFPYFGIYRFRYRGIQSVVG